MVPVPAEGESEEDKPQEEIVVRETIRVLPASWLNSFGESVMSMGAVKLLDRVKINEEWDVLRPAKEVEDLNILTSDQLDALMKEAEEIMARWDKIMEGSTENG